MQDVQLKRFIKRLLGYGFLGSCLFMLVISLIGFRYSESKEKLTTTWIVEAMYIDGEDATDDFYRLEVSLLRDGTAIFPKKKYTKSSRPMIRSNWGYKRVGFADAEIVVEDLARGIFDGVYSIEVLTNNEPQRLLFSSDRIDLYVRKHEVFTINRTTILDSEPWDTVLKYIDTTSHAIDTLGIKE